MKSLFLTRGQAESIADNLKEYIEMNDSSQRELFEFFEIKFPDEAMEDVVGQLHGDIEIHPKANYLIVSNDEV